jgi:hypothetical protein
LLKAVGTQVKYACDLARRNAKNSALCGIAVRLKRIEQSVVARTMEIKQNQILHHRNFNTTLYTSTTVQSKVTQIPMLLGYLPDMPWRPLHGKNEILAA